MEKLTIAEHKERIQAMINMAKKDPNRTFLKELYILCNLPNNYLNTRLRKVSQLEQIIKDLYTQLEENKIKKFKVKKTIISNLDKAHDYNRANQKYFNFLKYGAAEPPKDIENKTPHLLDLYKLG